MKSHRLLRSDAARIWTAAIRAVEPESAIRRIVKRKGRVLRVDGSRFDLGGFRKIWILGAGKAAGSMGRAMERILGPFLAGGLLVTKYGHSVPLKKLQILEAGHPLPDQNSLTAASEIISMAESRIDKEDLVFCLLSGGASSLLVSPAPGISLEDKLTCTRLLMNGGADIRQLNAIRKHLSCIKGGKLARMLAPAKVVSLILSDVVGDDVGTIASGLMSPDPTSFGNCLEIFRELRLSAQIPPSVRERLELGSEGAVEETPKENDPAFRNAEVHIVGSGAQACTAAGQAAKKLGYNVMILTSRLDGDTREAARFHMSVAGEVVFQRRPLRPPCCILSGGETTVRLTGSGKGGRNQEFALQCIRQLTGFPAPCVVASVGTDGNDGPTDAAGAIADNTTLSRSIKFGASFLDESIENNNSYHFFERLGDLIITGPTRTNVGDLHIILVG